MIFKKALQGLLFIGKPGFFLGLFAFAAAMAGFAETRTFNEVAVEISGAKFWLPSTIVVKKGDTVKIHAVSKVPGANSVHGFSIDAFHVSEVINDKGKDITFVADKEGIFPMHCQMHPAHVGGQLIVVGARPDGALTL